MPDLPALVKRHEADMALMPPPPTTRIKRPATVLDEDDYTEALEEVIARDYFPGLAEVKAQDEYLSALESNNKIWIRDARERVRRAISPSKSKRSERDARYNTPRPWDNRTPVAQTPHSLNGMETPVSVSSVAEGISEGFADSTSPHAVPDASSLSLSQFQAKYTSEDNESFNGIVDKQNSSVRKKHAYLWTPDQRIPSHRLLMQRERKAKLLAQQQEDAEVARSEGRELIPISTGATADRAAMLDTWKSKVPANTFMFNPTSVDENDIPTIMEAKEAASRAPPKQIVHQNTRFPPLSILQSDHEPTSSVPASPSLDTQVIAARDARRGNGAEVASNSFTGDETPRVNGYAFVDEEEPEDRVDEATIDSAAPSYRDILAGQAADGLSNPFKITEQSRREALHWKLVDKEKRALRAKDKMTARTPVGNGFGSGTHKNTGNMTPAARMLMAQLGKTPGARSSKDLNGGGTSSVAAAAGGGRDMWTPGKTPRRK